jgi:tetratricopeptide (TPR) repeat protein
MLLRRSLLAFSFICMAAAAEAQSTDRIRTARGSESGEITKMTPLAVTISSGGQEKEIPLPEIRSIIFRGEPSELTQARLNANNGGYENALAALDSINPNSVRGEYIEQEIAYYKAFSAAKLALVGNRPIPEAGSALQAFASKYPQSFHYLEANELLGDLLVHMGNYAAAQKKYETLASQSTWPSYKMRSGVLVGQTLLAQKKYPEALSQFQAVVALNDESPEGKQQMLAAQLGLGVATAATGKLAEGIQRIETVIRDADPENARLLAQAYNALGASYSEAGRSKDALYAYLHVDLLYGRIADAHAEALYHLIALWETVGQDGEARKARQSLEEKYPSSRWAKQAGT